MMTLKILQASPADNACRQNDAEIFRSCGLWRQWLPQQNEASQPPVRSR